MVHHVAWSTSPVLSGCALAGLSGGARGDLRATWLSFIAINNINVIFDRESVDIRRFRVRIPGRILCPVGPTVRRLTTELFCHLLLAVNSAPRKKVL